MRNLIGRLNARSSSDLDRIAGAWRAPVSATDKSALVAQVFRTLTDLRAVRDAWSSLEDDERAFILLLARTDEPLSLPDLAASLGSPPETIRNSAIRLYRSGWIAREGDNSELRVDEQPRLFVPSDLAHLVRRVQAEIDAGDRSTTSLEQLLRELDMVELEIAAQRWGISIIPGLRERDALVDSILLAVAEPGALDRVKTGLDRDAAAIFDAVCAAPPDGLPIDFAIAAAGIETDAAGTTARARIALGALERSLLVWHGYDWKGERRLFVPAEISSPAPLQTSPPPTPISIHASSNPEPYHFHLAWDVLTLLRALASPGAPRTRPGDPFPAAWLQRLNRRLWHSGPDSPPAGYLPFLTALARGEGLIVPEDGRGAMSVTNDFRSWRDRDFEEQDARLRWRWLTAIDWIEGNDQSETHVWGADWRSMRRQLLESMAEIPDGEWRSLDQVAQWIIGREPGLLGRAYTVAVGIGVNDDGPEARRIAAQSIVSLTIRRAFTWFGLVETRRAAAHSYLMRVTPRGRAVARGEALDEVTKEPELEIRDDGVIALTDPEPVQIWAVSAFADLLDLGRPARYRLSARSIERAIESGFQATQIAAFLRRQTGEALPDTVSDLLEKEQRDHPIVRLGHASIISPVSQTARDQLIEVLKASAIEVKDLGDALLVDNSTIARERLTAILKSAGFVVRENE